MKNAIVISVIIHFGLYSQLGGIYEGNDEGRYAEWIQANQQIPKSDYIKLIEKYLKRILVHPSNSILMEPWTIIGKHVIP